MTRRPLVVAALWPPILILGAYALYMLGAIGIHLYFIAITALTFFLLGKAVAILQRSEQDRRQAARAMEMTIGGLQQALDADVVPEEFRDQAERDLSAMVETLDSIDRCAPWHTRLRRRRVKIT